MPRFDPEFETRLRQTLRAAAADMEDAQMPSVTIAGDSYLINTHAPITININTGPARQADEPEG